MTILSASRRTDIPAFYTDWFINRIHEEYVLYPLPWSDKLKYLELTPDNIDIIVFWSKNYEHLIPYLKLLDNKGYDYYFHFTINNYPSSLEANVVKLDNSIEQFKKLADHKTSDNVLWRYDPIITTDKIKSNFHLYNFEKIAYELQGYTKRCYIEFVDLYKKVQRNFERKQVNYSPLSQDQKIQMVNAMANIAIKYEIEVYSCCEDTLVQNKIKKAQCIDPDLIMKLTGKTIKHELSPTRKECGCIKSIDIGEYGTCLHGCLYCYANENISTAEKFFSGYDVGSAALDSKKLLKFENQNLAKTTKKDDGQLKLF